MVTLEKKKATKHSKIETLSLFGLRVSFGPVGLIVLAEHYAVAADVVRNSLVGQRWSPVEKFLACRSIELGLKAFLSLKGRALEELAGGLYGHDLENLLKQAEDEGLQEMTSLTTDERAAIHFAQKYYFDKVFEYPALAEALRAYPGDPADSHFLISAAERLVFELKQPCAEHGAASGEVGTVVQAGSTAAAKAAK
jgi:hypothetical protein